MRKKKGMKVFDSEELMLILSIVRGLDAEHYVRDEAKAVIYKVKSVENHETIWFEP